MDRLLDGAVKLTVGLIKWIPIPRFKRPPVQPVRLLDKALQNRYRPTARVTFLGHVIANCSDLWFGVYHGIRDDDYVVRDHKNRYRNNIRRM